MDKCRVVNTSYLASLEKHWLSIVFFKKSFKDIYDRLKSLVSS
jgi:hypothetical protein